MAVTEALLVAVAEALLAAVTEALLATIAEALLAAITEALLAILFKHWIAASDERPCDLIICCGGVEDRAHQHRASQAGVFNMCVERERDKGAVCARPLSDLASLDEHCEHPPHAAVDQRLGTPLQLVAALGVGDLKRQLF